MLTSLSGQIVGIILISVVMAYSIRVIKITHRFSYVRMGCVLLLAALFYGSAMAFCVLDKLVGQNVSGANPIIVSIGICIASLMFGALFSVFGLWLGCSKEKGMPGNIACKALKCRVLQPSSGSDLNDVPLQ